MNYGALQVRPGISWGVMGGNSLGVDSEPVAAVTMVDTEDRRIEAMRQFQCVNSIR